jgi:hypothetical protein
MTFGKERSLESSTSRSLEVNVIFFETRRIWESLIPKLMKGYSWGTPPTVMLTGCLINKQKL